ncbi:MAG: TerB family tellurite resistance protein [Bacteroidota bacterium]|nr:TerB family tellurite resistance protein [Bacteroidota bacterium]MDP3557994.1 TerB family tellurite resistance protein [Bacteroidota bacterium]
MTPTQNLHYAIGELAYAVAQADGAVQKEERQKFHDMVEAGLRCQDYDFNISDIIFKIMDKDKTSTEDAYNGAMKQIRTNSHYLSPELKATFIKVMEKVAMSYAPVTIDEMSLIDKFKAEIAPLKGDPIYYEKRS